MLRGLISTDRTRVVVAPEEFAQGDGNGGAAPLYRHPQGVGSKGSGHEAAAHDAVPSLTSETPEEVYVWRGRLSASAELQEVATRAFDALYDGFADDKAEAIEAAAVETVRQLRQVRRNLDRLQQLLGDGEGQEPRQDEAARKLRTAARQLSADYVKLGILIYGASLPLDSATREPVLAEGLEAYPFLDGFAIDEGAPTSEMDTLGIGAAFGLAVRRYGIDGLGTPLLVEAEDGTMQPLVDVDGDGSGAEDGAGGGGTGDGKDEAPGKGATQSPPVMWVIVDDLALSPVALTVAASLHKVATIACNVTNKLVHEGGSKQNDAGPRPQESNNVAREADQGR